jgi:hypothetical protein
MGVSPDGYRSVPVLFTHAELGSSVDGFIASPSTPAADCAWGEDELPPLPGGYDDVRAPDADLPPIEPPPIERFPCRSRRPPHSRPPARLANRDDHRVLARAVRPTHSPASATPSSRGTLRTTRPSRARCGPLTSRCRGREAPPWGHRQLRRPPRRGDVVRGHGHRVGLAIQDCQRHGWLGLGELRARRPRHVVTSTAPTRQRRAVGSERPLATGSAGTGSATCDPRRRLRLRQPRTRP